MLTYLPHPHTLAARVGTLEHHGEKVGREPGIRESGGLAKADDALVLSKSIFLDDASRRMVGIGQLGERVHQRGPSLFHRAKLGGGSPAPVLELALRISAVFRGQVFPLFLFVGDYPAHPFGDQLVLLVEVAVQGHLVRLRRLGDRFDADAPDTLFMKQVPSGNENPLANGDPGSAYFLRLGRLFVNICLHDRLYPSLTKMLPTGNIGVLAECYRSVTYYMYACGATTIRWSLQHEFHFLSRQVGLPQGSRGWLGRRCDLRRWRIRMQQGAAPDASSAGNCRSGSRARRCRLGRIHGALRGRQLC